MSGLRRAEIESICKELRRTNTEALPSSHSNGQEVAGGASHRVTGNLENFSNSPSWNIPASTEDNVLRPLREYSQESTNSNSPKNRAPLATLPTVLPKATTVKRVRTTYTSQQLYALEKAFKEDQYICHTRKFEFSKKLGLRENQIKFWFQNRRKKHKRESKKESVESTKSPLLRETPSLSPTSVSTDSNLVDQSVLNRNSWSQDYSNQDDWIFPQQHSTTTERMVYQQNFDQEFYQNEPQQTRSNFNYYCNTNQQNSNTFQSQNINTMGHDDPYNLCFPPSQPNYQNEAYEYRSNYL